MIAWLRARQDVLKISTIGRKSGISNLKNIVDNRPDGRGYYPTLADKHLPKLNEVITKICTKE